MRLNKISIAFSALFSLSLSAHADPTPPTHFDPQEATPDLASMIDNPAYGDAWQYVMDKWGEGYPIIPISSDDKKFIRDRNLTRFISGLASQVVTIRNGGFSLNNTLDSVQMDIESGSIAVGTTVIGNTTGFKGVLSVTGADSKAYDTVVENNGLVSVRGGAKLYNTYVNQGGEQGIGYGGYAQANIIDGGQQTITVGSDGVAEDTLVINGGQQIIYGGMAFNSHIGAGSYQMTSGLSVETKVYNGGYQVVYAGGGAGVIADQDSVIFYGGTQRIQSGIANRTSVYGEQIVSKKNGDWVNGTWVEASGYWGNEPEAHNATIYAGGVQRIEHYGGAIGTTVDGGKQFVNELGYIENTEIKNGGATTIDFGGYSLGYLRVLDGSLTMVGGDTHSWSGSYGDGAFAEIVDLQSENSTLYIQHNDSTSRSTVTVEDLYSNGGIINFGRQDGSDLGKYSYLTVDSLYGNGTIIMNTNIIGGLGDFLYVENKIDDSDSFKVGIKDNGTDTDGYRHHIITAGNNSTSDSFNIHEGYRYGDAGAYMVEYTLEHETDSFSGKENWYVVSSFAGTTAPSTDAVLSMANVTPSIVDAELSTLRQRLGELDNSAHKNGLWGKYITSRYKVEKDSGPAYKQGMNGFVIGADRATAKDNGTLHLGMMGGYSRSDIDFRRGGDGKVDSYMFGGYATYIADSGFYVDGVAKYNYFKNTTDARSTHGDLVSGKYNVSGVGASVEIGKKYERENTISAPYVMLSGFYANSADFTLSNDMYAEVGRTASVKAELGHVLGRNIKLENGNIKPYIRTAVSREFIDSNKVTINNADRFNNNMSGVALKVGLGVTAQINDRFDLYGEIDYMKATDISMPYSANVGLRYSF